MLERDAVSTNDFDHKHQKNWALKNVRSGASKKNKKTGLFFAKLLFSSKNRAEKHFVSKQTALHSRRHGQFSDLARDVDSCVFKIFDSRAKPKDDATT